MSEVTVKQLAETVGTPVDRLLKQMQEAGLTVLVESAEVGVHMAVSPDGFRMVYFQGHPEYDAISLLKEFKREVFRYLADEIEELPPLPQHYFSTQGETVANRLLAACAQSKAAGSRPPKFPEQELMQCIDNTWGDTGKAIVNNWLGHVYQLTNLDRKQQFMDGVDRDNPLNLRN